MWRSYVAMGDSFTEGLDDPDPLAGGYRGWADLVAARLAADIPGFAYANLAIRGRLFAPIVAEQVPVALELRPELMSFAAGGNDALRRGFDPARLSAALDEVGGRLRATGADLLLFTFAPANLRLPGRQIFHGRARLLNPAAMSPRISSSRAVMPSWRTRVSSAMNGPDLSLVWACAGISMVTVTGLFLVSVSPSQMPIPANKAATSPT